MEGLGSYQKQNNDWQVLEDLRYDNNNFWIKIEGRQAFIGLTDYGQWSIGDILYLDIAREGSSICRGERFGSVESGKWVGNLMSPVTGLVLENNPVVVAEPRHINIDPYGMGWILKVELEMEEDLGTFMDHAAYTEWMKEQVLKEQVLKEV